MYIHQTVLLSIYYKPYDPVSLIPTPQICRYEVYIQVLEAWKSVKQTDEVMLLSSASLSLFDKAMHTEEAPGEEDSGLKRSHSSPSLELDMAAPTVIKVRRNISERRTYRRTIIPRRNKDV